MDIKQKELIIFIIIVAIITAFLSPESQRFSLLILIGSALGGIIAMVSYDTFIRDWLFDI